MEREEIEFIKDRIKPSYDNIMDRPMCMTGKGLNTFDLSKRNKNM